MDNPLVSIAVIAYNSSKYIVETLEGIKSQTYQNIELIFSDDGSKDDTVALYKDWIASNASRFVRTRLITVPQNTGTSANYNRAEDACQGDWVMTVDGDDVLLSNCITDFVEYVQDHPESIYVFGKMNIVGTKDEEYVNFLNNAYNPDFFKLSSHEQLEKIVFENNCIPAPACFFNRIRKEEYGIRNDERIPIIEDWPKWINILDSGIRLDYLDKFVVNYRVGSGVSTRRPSIIYWRSYLLTIILYCYPKWKERDEFQAATRLADISTDIYKQLIDNEMEIYRLRNTNAYKIGKFILSPISRFQKWINHLFNKTID